MARQVPHAGSRGFSLVEALVALTLLVIAVGTLAGLIVATTRANVAARITTIATLLAVDKMEQLRALAWSVDASGQPLADTATDVTVFPPSAATGVGLTPSPDDALTSNTPGYCDFLDAGGRLLGGGATPTPQAVFVRRWAVNALPANPANTLVLQVVVSRVRRTPGGALLPAPADAYVATLKTRKTA